MLTQQWQYLNLVRNSIYILFPAKDVIQANHFQPPLYICLKRTCALASQALLNTAE